MAVLELPVERASANVLHRLANAIANLLGAMNRDDAGRPHAREQPAF